MRTIWVTGSRGFVGRSLVSALEKAGARVLRFTNQQPQGGGSSAQVERKAEAAGESEGRVYPMNYLDAGAIRERVEVLGCPDAFVHAGWGEMTKPESAGHLGENVEAGKTLIETLFEQGLRNFVFVGSMNEYGARTGLLSEDFPPEGRLTNYAKAKIEVGRFGFEAAQRHGRNFIHARTFYVYGAGQRQGSLINDLYQAYCRGTEVGLSPCEHFRDYIHVSDVAEGLRRLSEIEQSTTVNLGSGGAVKVKNFVMLFWRLLGGDEQKLRFGARQVGWDEPEQPKSYADLSRVRKLINWTPALSLEDGIRLTIRDLKGQNPG